MCSIILLISRAELSALVMPNFEIDLEYRDFDQFSKIADNDANIANGVDAFTENYRAHMWKIRNYYAAKDSFIKEGCKVVDYKNLYFYRTVYNLIPTELARAVFGIKGGAVEYTNNSADVLECIGDNYKPIGAYSRSNWNYILLVNLINTAMNSAEKADINLLNSVYDRVKNKYRNKGEWTKRCEQLLEKAKQDIKQYARILLFENYLERMRKVKNALANIGEWAESRVEKAKNSHTFEDSWGQNVNLPKEMAAWLEITKELGEGSIPQYSGDYIPELSIHYLSEICDHSKWSIDLTYRIEVGGMLFPHMYLYVKRGWKLVKDGIFFTIYEQLRERKYVFYNELKNDENLRQKIRKAMKYIRCQAEEGRDVTRYKFIINLNSILDELPLTPKNNPLMTWDTPICGLPDIWKFKSYTEDVDFLKAMQETWQIQLDEYIKELEKIISDKSSGKDIKEVISEQIDAIGVE